MGEYQASSYMMMGWWVFAMWGNRLLTLALPVSFAMI